MQNTKTPIGETSSFDEIRIGRRAVLAGAGALAGAAWGGVSTQSALAAGSSGTAHFHLDRLAITVADLERATAFYKALGFDVGETHETPAAIVEKLVDVPAPMHSRMVSRSGISLELMQWGAARDPGIPVNRPFNQKGLTHLALRVADFEGVLAAIRKNGGTVVERSRINARGVDAVFCNDPDGVKLQVVASLKPSGDTTGGVPKVELIGTGVSVADIDLSLRFYKALGFEGEDALDHGAMDDNTVKLTELDRTTEKNAHLHKDGIVVELVQFGPSRAPGIPAIRPLNQQGLALLAIDVDDFDAAVAMIGKFQGLAVKRTLLKSNGGGGSTREVMTCTDPDGTRISLSSRSKKT